MNVLTHYFAPFLLSFLIIIFGKYSFNCFKTTFAFYKHNLTIKRRHYYEIRDKIMQTDDVANCHYHSIHYNTMINIKVPRLIFLTSIKTKKESFCTFNKKLHKKE